MGYNEANADIETYGMAPSPYIRVNRTAGLTLTTTYQRIDFNGTSTRNTNIYPTMPNGHQMVEWNSTDKVFNFYNTIFRHYDMIFNFHINSATLISALNLTATTVKMRFVVPSPTPRYFPLPDDGGEIDLAYTSLSSDVRNTFNYILRSVADVQQYGIGIDVKISTGGLGAVTLVTGDMSLYGR